MYVCVCLGLGLGLGTNLAFFPLNSRALASTQSQSLNEHKSSTSGTESHLDVMRDLLRAGLHAMGLGLIH